MFPFTWSPYTEKPNNDKDVEMGYIQPQDADDDPLLEHTSPSLSMIRVTDDRTISQGVPAVIPSLVASQPSQQVVHFAPNEKRLVATRRNLQPPRSPSRHQQSKSPQPPGSPSRHRRSKSPSTQVAMGKVRIVAQEDLQREKEFESMKKNIAWQTEMMKEIQAQLKDFQRRVETAEVVAQEAERRLAEAEGNLRIEKENAAKRMADIYRQIQLEEQNMQGMLLEDIEDMPAGPSRQAHPHQTRAEKRDVDSSDRRAKPTAHAQTPGPSRVGRTNDDGDLDMSDDQGHSRSKTPVTGTRAKETPCMSGVPKPIPRRSKRLMRKSPPPVRANMQPDPRISRQGISKLGMDEKLDLILKSLHQTPRSSTGHRTRWSGFKDPTQRAEKEEGRNERLAWVRTHMNGLIGIRTTKDILQFKDEIYAAETELQRTMARYEEGDSDEQPQLEPMKINWKIVNGGWNEDLFLQFLAYAEDRGYAEGEIGEEDEDELRKMFYAQIDRMVGVINMNWPKPKETLQQTERRVQGRHKEVLSINRRNTRRRELFNARLDMIAERLPDPETSIEELDNESKVWLDNYKIVDTLGVDGQSSDETDEDNDGVYDVKLLDWRNKTLVKRLNKTDEVRRTTNKYGTRRPGSKRRTRKRKSRDLRPTAQPPPTGKPINFYNEDWYMSLTLQQKRDLKVEPAVEFLTSLDD